LSLALAPAHARTLLSQAEKLKKQLAEALAATQQQADDMLALQEELERVKAQTQAQMAAAEVSTRRARLYPWCNNWERSALARANREAFCCAATAAIANRPRRRRRHVGPCSPFFFTFWVLGA